MAHTTLAVDLTLRLPDINREDLIPDGLDEYGRFGILRGGTFWFAGIRSSHPDVHVGFYWAISLSKQTLFISPRGAATDMDALTEELIYYVMQKLQLTVKYKKYVIRK